MPGCGLRLRPPRDTVAPGPVNLVQRAKLASVDREPATADRSRFALALYQLLSYARSSGHCPDIGPQSFRIAISVYRNRSIEDALLRPSTGELL